jgi:hypothetical protein
VAEAVRTTERLRHGIETDIPGSEVRISLLPMEIESVLPPENLPGPGGPPAS